MREEQVFRIGQIELLQTHYRYNLDGALISTFTPEGILTQYLYGRDYFLKKHNLKDEDIFSDPNLDLVARLSFGDLISKLRRHTRMSISVIANNKNIWEDIFPDVMGAIDPDDIIIKYTYEKDYGQIFTVSNPRFTKSADPDFVENQKYLDTLTKYEYNGPPLNQNLFLSKIIRPATLQADGTFAIESIEEIVAYDNNGRLLKHKDANGVINEMSYNNSNSAKQGYLKETIVDSGGLNLKTSFEVDDLGRVVKFKIPRSAGALPGEFETSNKYNELDQVIKTTSSFASLTCLIIF